MDPGVGKRGGNGSRRIDPKSDLSLSLGRNRRRRAKITNTNNISKPWCNNGASAATKDIGIKANGTQQTSASRSFIQIQDRPVQSRAMASLPSSYLSIKSVAKKLSIRLDSFQNGTSSYAQPDYKGVFAKKLIPKSCRFGPLEGRLVDLANNATETMNPTLESQRRTLQLTIMNNGMGTKKIDISSEGEYIKYIGTMLHKSSILSLFCL